MEGFAILIGAWVYSRYGRKTVAIFAATWFVCAIIFKVSGAEMAVLKWMGFKEVCLALLP